MQMHNIRDGYDRSRSRWYDTRELIGAEALYEVSLPSGTRLDAWLPDEELAIEFKAGEPRDSDVIQVHGMMEELWLAGVSGFSFQLWYDARHAAAIRLFAKRHELRTSNVAPGFIAVKVDDPEDSDLNRLAELRFGLASLTDSLPPDPYEITSPPCARCGYYDYCHL
jgi:hypothetical protein